jgi:hypothetical protein
MRDLDKLLERMADFMFDHFYISVAIIVLIAWGLMSLTKWWILS